MEQIKKIIYSHISMFGLVATKGFYSYIADYCREYDINHQ